VGKAGKPFTKESFGNAFKDACVAAGLLHHSAHSCRKIAATRAADNGATVAELNAIFGWTGTAMASLYTEEADRKRLAREAMAKLGVALSQSANENTNFYARTLRGSAGARGKSKMKSRGKIFSGAVERTRTSTGCPASTSS
jgi:hypothetical protein